MKQKRQFHCERCGNPCTIYRKGKKHRVLVCPSCGVIATNPLPLLAALAIKGGSKLLSRPLLKEKSESPQAGTSPQRDTYTLQEMAKDLKVI